MRQTRQIMVGKVAVGGGAPVSIQSMTNTLTADVEATLAQIRRLTALGCDLVRVALPSMAETSALTAICAASPIPVIADIHFDYRLALAAIDAGAACIRLNPGNVKNEARVRQVARAARDSGCAVRIGVNGGSLAPAIRARLGHGSEALVASALQYIGWFAEEGCQEVKVSLKSSDVLTTMAACRQFAAQSDLPLHLGVTEAGPPEVGLIKSSLAIGALLLEGIGETIRVSLTAPPEEEVVAAKRILAAAGLRSCSPEIISCPTCGRTGIGLFAMVQAVQQEIQNLQAQGWEIGLRKIAVMGCEVNGPGEAKDADVGIAGGKGRGILFRKGEKIKSLPEEELLAALLSEIRDSCRKKTNG